MRSYIWLVTRKHSQDASSSPPVFDNPVRKTGIDDYKDYLTQRFTEHGLSAERLLAEIRHQGFTGSVCMIRRFLRKLRPMRSAAATATLRFETAPGNAVTTTPLDRYERIAGGFASPVEVAP